MTLLAIEIIHYDFKKTKRRNIYKVFVQFDTIFIAKTFLAMQLFLIVASVLRISQFSQIWGAWSMDNGFSIRLII